MTISCPHCSASNVAGSAFCTSCGKALPAASTGPRIVSKKDLASSVAGQALQSEDLRKKMRTAFTTLLVLSILQAIVGSLFLLLGMSDAAAEVQDKMGIDFTFAGVVVLLIGALFFGLAIWARGSPLPAALTGLVLIVSLWALDAVSAIQAGHPELIAQGWLIKLIILVALCNAVSAGVKHRALRRKMAQTSPGA